MPVSKKKEEPEVIRITPLRMGMVGFHIEGTAPLMIAKFSDKAKTKIKADHEAGSAGRTKKNREARKFDDDTNNARHIGQGEDGDSWDGIAASAFRNASIDACRAAGFVMTRAKLAVFCEADGYDTTDSTPLVRILSDKPFEQSIMAVRNSNGGMDLRARPKWLEWRMFVRIRHDLDILDEAAIVNLMNRVGHQVGIGEGRPYGRMGNGMGFGLFKIVSVQRFKTEEVEHAL